MMPKDQRCKDGKGMAGNRLPPGCDSQAATPRLRPPGWADYIVHCNKKSALFVYSLFNSKVKIKEWWFCFQFFLLMLIYTYAKIMVINFTILGGAQWRAHGVFLPRVPSVPRITSARNTKSY